jgi:hypothetical protein
MPCTVPNHALTATTPAMRPVAAGRKHNTTTGTERYTQNRMPRISTLATSDRRVASAAMSVRLATVIAPGLE